MGDFVMACWHSLTGSLVAVVALTLITCTEAAPIGLVDLDSITKALLQPSSEIYYHVYLDQLRGEEKNIPEFSSVEEVIEGEYEEQQEQEQEKEEDESQVEEELDGEEFEGRVIGLVDDEEEDESQVNE